MSHDITQREDGTAEAAFSCEPAWHGLGVTLDHVMSTAEALRVAQLDWEVTQRKIATVGESPDASGLLYYPAEGYRANVRSDNGFLLGIVSDSYQVVQNREAFEFLDALQDEKQIEIESAFSLNGGKQVVICARNPVTDEIVPGDELRRYLVIGLHHDGGGAVRFGPTSVRVVCANTYAMAQEQGNVKALSIRHTGKVADRIAEARALISHSSRQFEAFASQSRALAAFEFDRAAWESFLDVLCPVPAHIDPEWTQRREDRIRETRRRIEERYGNPRQTLSGIAGTAWAAFNAVSEYCDHLPRIGATKERRAEARFNVALYGAGRDTKRRAFVTACRLAGVAL